MPNSSLIPSLDSTFPLHWMVLILLFLTFVQRGQLLLEGAQPTVDGSFNLDGLEALLVDLYNGTPHYKFFQVYGTQSGSWFEAAETYDGSGDWQTFGIRVGDYFTGAMSYLTFFADDDRVTCVGPTLITDDDVVLLSQQVDNLPFGFVAPLQSNDTSSRHATLLVSRLGRCITGSPQRTTLI